MSATTDARNGLYEGLKRNLSNVTVHKGLIGTLVGPPAVVIRRGRNDLDVTMQEEAPDQAFDLMVLVDSTLAGCNEVLDRHVDTVVATLHDNPTLDDRFADLSIIRTGAEELVQSGPNRPVLLGVAVTIKVVI